MKKLLTSTFFLLIAIVGSAQITKVETPPIQEETIVEFDSTKNLIRPKTYRVYDPSVQAFVGQKLYLKPLEEGYKRKEGYIRILSMDYDPAKPPYLYRYGTYEQLKEKTFEVVKIDTFLTEYGNYIFTLKMIEDTTFMCKYIYDGESVFFPFITMSYYNHLCNTLLGRKYVISNFAFKEKPLEEQRKESSTNLWDAKNISISDNGVLYVMVNNGIKEDRIIIEDFLTYSKTEEEKKAIFSEVEWNKLVKQYGLNMMKLVLAQKIQVGMPTKLVIYAWGKPKRINRSSYGSDQWVYDSQYLYIRNGKVESWN